MGPSTEGSHATTRRTMLKTVSLSMVGAPILAVSTNRVFAAPGISKPKLSPALLKGVQQGLTDITTRIHHGNTQTGDLLIGATLIEMLHDHLVEVDFDNPFKVAATRLDPNTFENSVLAAKVYAELQKSDPKLSSKTVEAEMYIDPTSVSTNLSYLQQYGLTPVLASMSSVLKTKVAKQDAVFRKPSGIPSILRVSKPPYGNDGVCEQIKFYSDFTGLGAWALGFGCFPEPFFEVLCPTIVVLGIAAGFVAAIAMVVC